MATWNKVQISYVNSKRRIDSEFYRLEDIILEDHLTRACSGKKIRDFSFEIKDRFKKTFYSDNYFQYNDIGNTDLFFGFINKNLIKIKDAPGRACFINEYNDILISTVRPNRNANAIVDHSEFLQVGSNGFCNLRTKGVDPNYIFIISKSKQFIQNVSRASTSSMYPSITNRDILDSPFFLPNTKELCEIAEKVKRSRILLRKASELYSQATQLLERELGLDKTSFINDLHFRTGFSKILLSRRIDSQHFKPGFGQLIAHLGKNFNTLKLGNIVSKNRRGIQPVYVSNGKINVVNSQHITPVHLAYDNFETTSEKEFNLHPEAHIQYGDILVYTTGAYVGQTNPYLSTEPALASNHVNLLRVKTDIDSVYVALVLNTLTGKLQTEQHSRGSAQAELYPQDIAKFIIPLLPETTMNEIGNLVRESLKALHSSKELLAQAKSEVETLIEQAATKA